MWTSVCELVYVSQAVYINDCGRASSWRIALSPLCIACYTWYNVTYVASLVAIGNGKLFDGNYWHVAMRMLMATQY